MSLELQLSAISDAKVHTFWATAYSQQQGGKKKEILVANIVLNIFRNQMKMLFTFIYT